MTDMLLLSERLSKKSCPTCDGYVNECACTKKKSELKLFTAHVIWDDFFERENSWFTVLGKDAEDVEEAVITRLRENIAILGSPSDVYVMEVTEIVGPFTAGQILHEETGGDIKR